MVFQILGNAFLVAFAVDGVLSIADDLLGQEVHALSTLRGIVATVVLGLGIATALLVPLSRQLPVPVFGVPLLLLAWGSLGAFPLPLIQSDPLSLSLTIACAQVAASGFAFGMVRMTVPGTGWLLPRPPEGARNFEPSRAFILVAVGGVVAPLLLVGYLAATVTDVVERSTAGFIDIDTTGVHIVDRRYEKDGREIRLVGMIHIGNEDAYARIFEDFGQEGTLVLEEGVTDREGLLADRAPYEAFIEPLGLAKQQDAASYIDDENGNWPQVRRDDLDVSQFRPETLAYLAGLTEASDAFEARDFDRLLEILKRPEMQGSQAMGFFEDILTRRDEHLAGVLEEALLEYPRIVVPWGALHQRSLSVLVESWGYERTHEQRHLAIAWRDVAAALSGGSE